VQTLRGVADKEAVGAFEGRILALSKAHGLLGGKDWEAVSLRDVIYRILQPFGLNDRRVTRFSVKGDDVRLQAKAALTHHGVPRTGDQCGQTRRALERRCRKDRHRMAG
jgi:two-component sensor histidine kinase